MSTTYYRLILAVDPENLPKGFGIGSGLVSDDSWRGSFLESNFQEDEDGSYFLVQSRGNWIGEAFKDLVDLLNYPQLSLFTHDEAVVHPCDLTETLAPLVSLIELLEHDPRRVAAMLGYSERDMAQMTFPLEEWSYAGNEDHPGMGLEYLLLFSRKRKGVLEFAMKKNWAAINMNLTW